MSNSRLEKFIYAICSMEVSDLPAPLSRIEILWNCLITGETPDFKPQSRNEQYLMAMLGLYELDQLPTPMSRGEKLLYKIAMGETDLSDVPAYLSRYEELLGYLAENGGVGDFEYILQTLNQRLSTLYSTKERPMKQAVIKGDTLVNELPRPSLKNTMANVTSQKLNQGYDSINVVDGEFKQAIVKGQTLVNLGVNTNGKLLTPTNINYDVNCSYLEVGKTYYVIVKTNSTSETGVRCGFVNNAGTSWDDINNYVEYSNNKLVAKKYTLVKSKDSKFRIQLKGPNSSTPSEVNNLIEYVLILEYQQGMENWDIPYFEGMQSVKMPVLTTTGKNLFDGKNMFVGYINSNNGTVNIDNTENSLSDYIKVEPSTSYAYKCFVENQTSIYGEFAFYDEDKKFISVLYAHHTSDTCIITPDNCHYLRVWNKQYTNNGKIHPNAMLVKTTNLPSTLIYEPYKSNTLTLAEPVNLRKVGDVEDEFDALTGQVTENLIEVSLGSLTNIKGKQYPISSHTNTSRYSIYIDQTYGINVENDYGLSDKIPYKNTDDDDFHFKIGKIKNACFIYVPKNELETDDWDGFVKWAKNKDFKMVLKRSKKLNKTINPTITDQDGATQTKLHSFNDGNLSVSSQGLLPSAVNYEVPTNNSYYLPDMLTLGAQYTSRGSADCNATIDGKLLALGKNRTFTTPSGVTDKLMVLDAPVDDLMFIKGDHTAKDFGYFEGMKSVRLSNKMPVLKTTGKNLLNPNTFEERDCGIRDIVGLDIGNVKGRPSTTRYLTILKVKPSTTYTIGLDEISDVFQVFIGYANQDYIGTKNVNVWTQLLNNKATTFTTDSDTHYLFLNFHSGDYNVQLEESPSATSYEPFKSNILSTSEDVELRGIGDVKDTLDLLTGEMTQRIGEIVLDETLDYQGSSSANGENTMYFQFDLGAYPSSTPISHYFKVSSANLYVSVNDYEAIRITSSGELQLRILKSKLPTTDTDGVKEFFKQNNISIQYQLATESIKTVDLTTVDQDGQPTKLKTFNDITYVEINADSIIPSVNVEVATKINETLSTMGLEHHDVSEAQNKLSQTIDEQTENTDATMMATTEIYEQTL